MLPYPRVQSERSLATWRLVHKKVAARYLFCNALGCPEYRYRVSMAHDIKSEITVTR